MERAIKSVTVGITDEELANAKFPELYVFNMLKNAGIPIEAKAKNLFNFSSLLDILIMSGTMTCEFRRPGENFITFRWRDD